MSKPHIKRTEPKLREKFSVAKVFSKHFQVLSRGTWKFSRELLARLTKPHTMCPEEHFHSKFFEASLQTFQLFRIVNGVSVTTATNYSQGWQSCKKYLEQQTKEKLISKEKSYCSIIFNVSGGFFFVLSEKLPAWLSKLQPTYFSKILRLNSFWKIAQFFNFLLSLRFEKIRAFSQ